MTAFDWHSGEITRATPITTSYRSTQKARRFFKAECGDHFKFDRHFMAWLKAASGQTMETQSMNGIDVRPSSDSKLVGDPSAAHPML